MAKKYDEEDKVGSRIAVAVSGIAGVVVGAGVTFITAPISLGFICLGVFVASLGVGIGAIKSRNMPEFMQLFKHISGIIQRLIANALPLCNKLKQYYDDICIAIDKLHVMQGSLSNEDRSHIFITLDSIYNACHSLHRQSLR